MPRVLLSPLCAVLLVAVTACGSSPASPSAATADGNTPPRIVVLGDSLAVTPSMSESFPAQLQRRIDAARLPWRVTNAGITGDTTSGGAQRIDALLEPDVEVLVLALGANDGLDGVDVQTIERNLSAIVDAARRKDVDVLLCGMETPPTRGFSYTVAFHGIFPRVAQAYALPLVPFLLSGVALVPEMNGPDRVHPNAAGARRIADNVWLYLEPLLRQARAGYIPTRISTPAMSASPAISTPGMGSAANPAMPVRISQIASNTIPALRVIFTAIAHLT